MDQRFTQESSETRLTQQEAAEMIELWTRQKESADSSISLTDVQEVLHISEAEARDLLRTVRKAPEPPAPKVQQKTPVILWILLGLSMYFAASFAWWMISLMDRGSAITTGDAIGTIACVAWVVGWIWYLRRPTARIMANAVSRVVGGKS